MNDISTCLVVYRSPSLILANLYLYFRLKYNKFNVRVHIVNSIEDINNVLENVDGRIILSLHGCKYLAYVNGNRVMGTDLRIHNNIKEFVFLSCRAGNNPLSIAYVLKLLYPDLRIIAPTSNIGINDIQITCNPNKSINFGKYTANMEDISTNNYIDNSQRSNKLDYTLGIIMCCSLFFAYYI